MDTVATPARMTARPLARPYNWDAIETGELVRAAGLEPAQTLRSHGFSYHFGFRRRHSAFVVWTIPSPWLVSCRCRPSSLYTFLLAEAWLGIASEGFPEFEQFCSKGFPKGTQSFKSDASTNFATPA